MVLDGIDSKKNVDFFLIKYKCNHSSIKVTKKKKFIWILKDVCKMKYDYNDNNMKMGYWCGWGHQIVNRNKHEKILMIILDPIPMLC